MTEIILTSSVLILLLALLRRVLRGRLNPCVQYALWLLVAARLLIPGTLFSTPVSVLGAAEQLQASILLVDPAETPAGGLSGGRAEPSADSPSAPVATQAPSGPSASSVPQAPSGPSASSVTRPGNRPAAAPPARPAEPLPAGRILNEIWKVGMAAAGTAMIVSNLVFYLRLRRNRKPLALPAGLWSEELPVYGVSGLPSPCLFGLFRPAVYLNEAAMDAAHPEHILAHEYAHYRHGDHMWSVLRSICLVIHWYNPLVWWAAALSRRDCEMACDAAALGQLGEAGRIDYGQTLLGMVSKGSSPAALLHTATTMTAGKRAMTERIALIIKQPRMRKTTLTAVVLAVCILISCAFGGKSSKAEDIRLMEFPGLHWNDSVETVIGTLGITGEQILENSETDTGEWCLAAENVSGFGAAAEKAFFYFQRCGSSEWGLHCVRLDYPNDADFDAVREDMIRKYGPGSETAPDTYHISGSGTLQTSQSAQPGPGFQEMMLDLYGQETMDRRAEIREQPGPHAWYWSLDSGALPEAFPAQAAAWLAENMYTPISLETAQEFFQLQPMVRIFWTDAAPLNWSRPGTTFNQVCLDATEYVYHLQHTAGESQAAEPSQLLEFPGLHWNDTPEAVMKTLGVTEDDFLSTMSQGSVPVDTHLAYEFTLENPSFDPAAQFAVFHFSQYRGTGHEMGLDMVTVCYPEDMENFDALREGFVRQYGPGIEGDNDPYTADIIKRSLTDTHSKREIDAIVGRDRLSRWEELIDLGGPHYFSWEISVDDLPAGQAEAFQKFYEEQGGRYVYPGLWSKFVPEFPFMAQVTWSDRSLENYTFNQVTYDARNYVAFLQPACPVVLPTVSSLVEFPGLHWNDSVETVMDAMGVTVEGLKFTGNGERFSNGEGSDGQVFHFVLNDVPLYGSTAYSAIFRFIRYPGQERLGLYAVEMNYANDGGAFDAVLDELRQRYGQETKSTNVVHEVTQAKKDFLGDQADEWEELQKQTGVNMVYWESGSGTLPEGFAKLPEDAFSSWRIFYSEDMQYDPMPVSRVTWSSNSRFTQSFNTVIFDGGGYVYCLQNPSASDTDWKNRYIIEQVRKGADPGEWLDCIEGLDWAGFRETAEGMGLDGTETELAVLEALRRFVEQNDLTMGQIMYILTASDGLTAFVRGDETGTPEAVYRDIVSDMHAKDPPLFAFALLAKVPDEHKDAALKAFCYSASKDGRILSPEEAVGQLENDLKSNPSANPTEIVLTRKGETSRFLPDTVYSADSAAYSSYDSSIATVTDGIITAVSPGETNISLVTGDEGAHIFTCHVRCVW